MYVQNQLINFCFYSQKCSFESHVDFVAQSLLWRFSIRDQKCRIYNIYIDEPAKEVIFTYLLVLFTTQRKVNLLPSHCRGHNKIQSFSTVTETREPSKLQGLLYSSSYSTPSS